MVGLMHRFYVAPEDWNPDALILRGGEAHHARDVLRIKRGDRVVIFNGLGREITGEIVDFPQSEVRLRKLVETATPALRCRITLAQAIPKGKNMDLIVQKAVEIGAAEIIPLISERTVVELGSTKAKKKQDKWQQLAVEAAKQCGQNWLPEVHLPRSLKDFFYVATGPRPLQTSHSDVATAHDLRLIGSLQPDALHLKKVLADYTRRHGDRPARVLMLVGPEGDFTPAELALAKTHGCLPITLGPIILRVETAAIYCLSVLSYELM
jgi:16S rRNA (uracil1498-N3)-methyltransferase